MEKKWWEGIAKFLCNFWWLILLIFIIIAVIIFLELKYNLISNLFM